MPSGRSALQCDGKDCSSRGSIGSPEKISLYCRRISTDVNLTQVHRLVVVDNEDRVIGVISLSDILTELVLKPSRKFVLFDLLRRGCCLEVNTVLLFAGYSKKSSSSSDVENTGTIPEETGSDDEIELATKAELLDQPLSACEDIAMMDEDDDDGSRALRDALNGVTMTETNNPAIISHHEMPTAAAE